MKTKIFVIPMLLLFFCLFISEAFGLNASPAYKIEFEKHSAPTDVVIEDDGAIGVYESFSGSYLKYDHNGTAGASVQKDFMKGGNCLVRVEERFLFCNNADASLDMLSNNFEKRASFRVPPTMKGRYDPTDALVAEGHVYSVDNDNHRVIKTNLATGEVESSIGGYGHLRLLFWYPYSLAVDSKGVLTVSEVMNTRVQKITKEFKFYEFIGKWGIKGGEFYRPTGIAVHAGKTLLVADGYTGLIQIFDMDGRFLGLLSDIAGEKIELGSITHMRVKGNTLAVVDAFNKFVHVYKLTGH